MGVLFGLFLFLFDSVSLRLYVFVSKNNYRVEHMFYLWYDLHSCKNMHPLKANFKTIHTQKTEV